jgi:hypothetical protein
MRPHFERFFSPTAISFELVYAFIVVLLCFWIYYITKEIYSLTKHKGIGFFRNTFLFFGLAFVFRFLFTLFHLGAFLFDIRITGMVLKPLSLIIVGYLSTMAIFSLSLSTMWKKIKDKNFHYLIHIIAFVIVLLVLVTRSAELLVLSQFVLMIFSIILSFINSRKSKKFSNLTIIYILLFVFWLLNLVVLSPIIWMFFMFKIFSYMLSILIFFYIMYRVSKWTK